MTLSTALLNLACKLACIFLTFLRLGQNDLQMLMSKSRRIKYIPMGFNSNIEMINSKQFIKSQDPNNQNVEIEVCIVASS